MSTWHSLEEVVIGRSVRLERHGRGVWRLVLSRPQARNALSAEMISELGSALGVLEEQPPQALRLVVLEGDGDVLCAGADLAHMRAQATAEPSDNLADARALAHVLRRLAALPVPVLAALRGAAMGGGLGLVACCDIVIAEESAVVALPEVRLGLLPALIGPYLVRKIGVGHTSALAFSGRTVGAREALAIGLVHRVVPPVRIDIALAEAVADLLLGGPEAQRRAKALLLELAPLPGLELEEQTVREIALARASDEGRAGLEAFLDRRPAPWAPVPPGRRSRDGR